MKVKPRKSTKANFINFKAHAIYKIYNRKKSYKICKFTIAMIRKE